MKYITLIIGLLVVGLLSVGCGKKLTPEEEALRASVVGEYEFKDKGYTHKLVFLENGVSEEYENSEKLGEDKWSIVNGEIHIGALDDADVGNAIAIFRINKDRSITEVAMIRPNGRREDIPKEVQSSSLNKIK